MHNDSKKMQWKDVPFWMNMSDVVEIIHTIKTHSYVMAVKRTKEIAAKKAPDERWGIVESSAFVTSLQKNDVPKTELLQKLEMIEMIERDIPSLVMRTFNLSEESALELSKNREKLIQRCLTLEKSEKFGL